MKKYFFVTLVLLCCFTCAAALAQEIGIPATAADAVALAPAQLPPVPGVTTEDTGDSVIYYFTGLQNWPLKNADRYAKGAYNLSYGLSAVRGKEAEPFSITVSKTQPEPLWLTPSSQKYDSLRLNFDPDWGTVTYQYRFPNDVIYELDTVGNLISYRFSSDKHTIIVRYDSQGYPWQIRCMRDGFDASYDALGVLSHLSYWGKESYTYEDDVWRNEDYDICDEPSDFSLEDVPALVFTPDEGAALVAARAEAVAACVPADPTLITGEDLSGFAPLPVVTEEEAEDGSLRVTVTGLAAWGFQTQTGNLKEDNGYSLHHLPHYPFDTVTADIPADLLARGDRWRDVDIISQYKGIEGSINYREHLQAWEFSYEAVNGDSYRFVLGGEPALLNWTYHANGRTYGHDVLSQRRSEGFYVGSKLVELIYDDDQLVEISATEGDGYGRVGAYYTPEGTLTVLWIEQNPSYEYDGLNDQWTARNYGEDVSVPCECPEGFPIDEWINLRPNAQTPLE